ncbi:MAG: Prokaryotic diacylglycerol kinase [Candidatus Woesebacteria bacterium GW2011_GWA1_33_30]|uniref:Prokaryotic diacylglycerol kinase n=1 Tax=Candidatus Woesebacteria bacterium GW2011_GWA2_33_28 TaxID=1618561 RepID=A0A0G0AAA4_9BACT|nr:MAG: Prokaryotic diacylglycerol kinase [Candidatus Woesebacteria bacterium GW2011_GWA2_33_28]KKP48974.1 MAG: Prokaryotic diacylglycerol kinase [Candidatus Woesebacteria bacterium GW2011_GWA1_33_30]KKP49919.1 MAG: Prokaryotic diacylglycerol kinase [Microgenomates group bacterium GW2011_GWC1_33_32]KKP52565.1 MAG: Prokaryotic diacylglycerol kinase [Candidatus Woesebacteria bacterium GW2011_GWB1_33_38]KKP56501.1 MAG: Prokaryotic diacylglycerol kinase [Microgenomates group bacterium GW2011_GWD1_3
MIDSFKYALNGIKEAITTEDNLVFHFMASLFVLIFAYFFEFSLIEFSIVVVAIFFVIITEIINTVIEKLSDIVSPEKSEKIRIIKDMSSAAVLLSAICSVVIVMLLFVPKL